MSFGFPRGSVGKDSTYNAGHPGLIPGQENQLEKEVTTHFIIFAGRIPITEEPGRLQSMGSQKSQTQLSAWAHMSFLSYKPQTHLFPSWEIKSSPKHLFYEL